MQKTNRNRNKEREGAVMKGMMKEGGDLEGLVTIMTIDIQIGENQDLKDQTMTLMTTAQKNDGRGLRSQTRRTRAQTDPEPVISEGPSLAAVDPDSENRGTVMTATRKKTGIDEIKEMTEGMKKEGETGVGGNTVEGVSLVAVIQARVVIVIGDETKSNTQRRAQGNIHHPPGVDHTAHLRNLAVTVTEKIGHTEEKKQSAIKQIKVMAETVGDHLGERKATHRQKWKNGDPERGNKENQALHQNHQVRSMINHQPNHQQSSTKSSTKFRGISFSPHHHET